MNRKKLRRVTLVLVGILLPVGAFGFGYFYSNKNIDNKVAQTLTVDGNIGGEVVNEMTNIDNIVPGDTINKNINILPKATAPSLLRVKIEPNWYDVDKKSDLSVKNIEVLYTDSVEKSFREDGSKDYWYKSGEYLYYMDFVTTKDKAMEIVKGIKFNGGDDDINANQYQGKNLKMVVDLDLIQAKHKAYSAKWGVIDENLKAKLDKLCESISTVK